MKRVLQFSLFLFLTISCYNLNAQRLVGGANLSTFEGDDVEGADSKFGPRFGVAGDMFSNISNDLFFRGNVLFNSYGAQDEEESDNKIILDYITFGVGPSVELNDNFALSALFQVNLLLNAKEEFEGESYDLEDTINSSDAGIFPSIEYVSDSGFGLEAGYYFGLSNLNNTDDDTTEPDTDLMNRSLNLSLVYDFGGF